MIKLYLLLCLGLCFAVSANRRITSLPGRFGRLVATNRKHQGPGDTLEGVPPSHVIADAHRNPLIAISQKRCLPTRVGQLARVFKPVLRGNGILCQLDTKKLLEACRHLEGAMKDIGQKQSARVIKANIDKVEAAYRKMPKKRRGTVLEDQK